MSELTSSTEVDGASSDLSVAASNAPAEDIPSPRPEITIDEHADDDPDSITHDFVHVSIPINADSDEIRCETNQPSLFAGYLEQYADYIPSLQIVSNVLPAWLFPASENVGATSESPDRSMEVQSFESWVNETINGDYTSSVEDERRFRECLVRAMSENFERLHRLESTFYTENCTVTEEELYYANSSESQFTRRLLLMLLRRDTHTMLTFIHRMLACESDAVKSILDSLHRHLDDSSFGHKEQCLCCILRERVNISLVTDRLPQCSSDLLTFVNTVSEEDQPGKPSNSERLWNKLFEIVNSKSLYHDVIRTIARAIESCGYHTDIVRMMQDNVNMERSSFVCTCGTMRTDESTHSQKSVEETRKKTQSQSTEKACEVTELETSQTDKSFEGGSLPSNKSYSESGSKSNKNPIDKCAKKGDSGASWYVEDLRKGTDENVKTFSAKNKRKPYERTMRNINKKPNNKEPELSEYQKVIYTNLKSFKRKEGPSGAAIEESKRRREGGDYNRRSSVGNCDLQIELMKIAGQENSYDSGFSILSMPSASSYGDSGVYDQSTNLSGGSYDHETVPKQIVSTNDINPNSKLSNTNENTNCTVTQEGENSDGDTYNTVVPSDHSVIQHVESDSISDNLDESQDASNV